ncbi:hypothetical protein [Cetobacterium sp.]|uniref:hypothetical protein n=1 Tax=Cetobacterium sp. TaxID=2071632 RepID=UPI003F373CC9
MFLKKYNIFKKNIDSNNLLFEEYAIDNLKLFQTYEDYELSEKDNFITMDFYNSYLKELDKLISKYRFTLSFLENYEKVLLEKSNFLDNQINNFANNSSNYSNSFLHLLNSQIDCNNIIDTKPKYIKNIEINDNKSIKKNNNDENLNCDIRFVNQNSIFVYFENEFDIKDIIVDFYNYAEFNIYGVLKDDSLEILFKNVNNDIPCFVNHNNKKYKGLYINSNFDIKNTLKTIIVKKNSENIKNVYGYIAFKINDIFKFSDFFIESNSNTKFYYFYEKDFQKMLKETNENFENAIPGNFNSINALEKNKLFSSSKFKESIYIVEFFDKDIQFSNIPYIYGKEI